LVKVLHELDPEAIFLEQRAADLEALTMRSPEVLAAKTYASLRRSEIVAVDEFQIPHSLFSDMNGLIDFVESTSDEYRGYVAQRDEMAARGLEAINSWVFEDLVEKCDGAMERAVVRSRDDALLSVHAKWIALLRSRDDAMVSNIYHFCRQGPESRGVFLVGAAHLPSLITRIESHVALEPAVATWELWNRQGGFNNRPSAK
jgi:hypothetical protein